MVVEREGSEEKEHEKHNASRGHKTLHLVLRLESFVDLWPQLVERPRRLTLSSDVSPGVLLQGRGELLIGHSSLLEAFVVNRELEEQKKAKVMEKVRGEGGEEGGGGGGRRALLATFQAVSLSRRCLESKRTGRREVDQCQGYRYGALHPATGGHGGESLQSLCRRQSSFFYSENEWWQ